MAISSPKVRFSSILRSRIVLPLCICLMVLLLYLKEGNITRAIRGATLHSNQKLDFIRVLKHDGPYNPKQLELTGAIRGKKLIVIWSEVGADKKDAEAIFKRLTTGECPIKQCEVSHNMSRAEEADAVVFHLPRIKKRKFPTSKPPGQVWVAMTYDPPNLLEKYHLDQRVFHDWFDWRMNYHESSDVVMPYGQIVKNWRRKKEFDATIDRREGKTKMVAWMVSTCNTPGRREVFIKQMSKVVPVDKYGSCGNLKCGSRRILRFKNQAHDCDEVIEKYHFYVAFENSICEDFVSEKLFLSLTMNVIPIVYGGANYSKITPPNSVIDATKYANPEELGNYLKQVVEDKDLYNSYFAWKADYDVEEFQLTQPYVCGLCTRLHRRRQYLRNGMGRLYEVGTPLDESQKTSEWYSTEKNCRAPQFNVE